MTTLITGPPASGKSTIARGLQRELCDLRVSSFIADFGIDYYTPDMLRKLADTYSNLVIVTSDPQEPAVAGLKIDRVIELKLP